MSTGFAGQFEDDRTGFKPKERARVTAWGNDAGKFVIIQREIVPGFYHVRLEKTGEDRVYEYNDLEPLIRPVLVEGGRVVDTPITQDVLTEEIAETVIRLLSEIKVELPPTDLADKTERALLTEFLADLDDVIISAVTAEVMIRRGIAALAQKGVA